MEAHNQHIWLNIVKQTWLNIQWRVLLLFIVSGSLTINISSAAGSSQRVVFLSSCKSNPFIGWRLGRSFDTWSSTSGCLILLMRCWRVNSWRALSIVGCMEGPILVSAFFVCWLISVWHRSCSWFAQDACCSSVDGPSHGCSWFAQDAAVLLVLDSSTKGPSRFWILSKPGVVVPFSLVIPQAALLAVIV
ncbi:hypothetical protein Ancab_028160, partial [Ancistrocladus abbreviatus]